MRWENNWKNKGKKTPLFYNFHYNLVKLTGALPAWLWLRPKIYYPFGKPDKKGALMVAANHSTFIDPIIVQLTFPWRYLHSIATKDLFDTRLKAWFFTRMHCIMVDKDNFSLASFHEVVSRLQAGRLVVIFPEGGLHIGGKDAMGAFKSGAVLMAHKAGARILPMHIVRREKWYHRQRILVGMPLDVGQLLGAMPSMEAVTQASETLRQKQLELVAYYESLPIYHKLHKERNETPL